MDQDPTIRSLLGRALDDVTGLMRQELRLAQAEVGEKVAQAQTKLIGILAGMLLGFCGLLTLIQAVVIGLAVFMPAWLASVLTGLALMGAAFVLFKSNHKVLDANALKPRRSLRSLKRDKDVVMEHVP